MPTCDRRFHRSRTGCMRDNRQRKRNARTPYCRKCAFRLGFSIPRTEKRQAALRWTHMQQHGLSIPFPPIFGGLASPKTCAKPVDNRLKTACPEHILCTNPHPSSTCKPTALQILHNFAPFHPPAFPRSFWSLSPLFGPLLSTVSTGPITTTN